MLEILSPLLPAAISDALSQQGYIAAGTAGAAIQWGLAKLQQKRLTGLRDLLLEEIGDGLKDIEDAAQQDELIAIIHRILRAAFEGTARANLRLLARIIAGQKAAGALKSDEFLYYADIIASLRYEEIILIGAMHKISKENEAQQEPWVRAPYMYQKAKQTLIPNVFATEEDFLATSGALTRTGLVIPVNAIGGMIYTPSPLMDKLCKLASFKNLVQEIETIAT